MNEKELVKKGLLIGLGMAAFAQEKVDKLANELMRRGHLSKSEGKKLVGKIYKEVDTSRKRVGKVVEIEMKRLLKTAVPTKRKLKRR
jgi:polyhydroxyalkanoate synthesis regulator phasin